jgi:P27 family predicted phage terminase small subunit
LTPPDWLAPEAKLEWARVMPEIAGGVESIDVATLAGYCEAWARYVAAERTIEAEGTVIVLRDDKGTVRGAIPAPAVGISRTYFDRWLKAAKELGMTPAARGARPTASGATQDKQPPTPETAANPKDWFGDTDDEPAVDRVS